MSYIGKTPTVGNFIKLDDISTSSTNSYTLQHNSVNFSPESANHMLVSLNGVIQAPNTSYSVSGSTITFLPSSGTLSSSDSIDFIMVYGNVLDVGVASSVADASITKGKMNLISDSSSAGLSIKGDGSVDGTLQLNCSQNSHGIKLKSPPHSAGASYTLTFPTTDGSADEFLKTDGSGVLSWGTAGGSNTPAFESYVSSSNANITQNTWTKLTFNTESYDTDNKYDNSSNYRFTPATAGKYFVYGMAKITWGGATGSGHYIAIYKNGSMYKQGGIDGQTVDTHNVYAVIDFNTTDYVELWGYSTSNLAHLPQAEPQRHCFGAYKIIT